MQLPRKPRLGSREPQDCPSEFYAVGAVCVKFIYGPKIPKKAPKDPRGTPEGAPRKPDAAPKTVPRRVKIASRWPAGILRGGRRARKIHRMPQRSQEGSEGASREPPPNKPKRARCSSQDRLKKAPRYLVWYRCKLKIARVSEHAPFEPHLRLAATLLVIKITYMKTAERLRNR